MRLIMSERDARGPEEHDAPLEWRDPSERGRINCHPERSEK